MSGAHTPGPWQFDGSVSVKDAAGNLVALVYAAPMGNGTHEGNARAIEAAPGLLAALQSVTEALAARLGTNAEEWPLVHAARDAIAKAKP